MVTHAQLGPIWYHSEPSDVLYSPTKFLGWNFFAASYSETALGAPLLYSQKARINTSVFIDGPYDIQP